MENDEQLLNLLEEIYVFVAMKHRECNPWRKALDEWQKKVEDITNWSAMNQIKNYERNCKNSDGT